MDFSEILNFLNFLKNLQFLHNLPNPLFSGYNFDYKDDFVIMSAMMKIKYKDSYNWLCDEMAIGFSENLLDFYKNHYKGFSKHDSYLLNLVCLMPDLKYFINYFIVFRYIFFMSHHNK